MKECSFQMVKFTSVVPKFKKNYYVPTPKFKNKSNLLSQCIKNLRIVFSEPGFYVDGDFGIRLETIMEVVKSDTPVSHKLFSFM